MQKVNKLNPDTLPPEVLKAHAAALAWIEVEFAGRRSKPLRAIIIPPKGDARDRILAAGLKVRRLINAGADRAALDAANELESLVLVETCIWAEGMPDMGAGAKVQPQAVARDYLIGLRDEAGTLGMVPTLIMGEAQNMIEVPTPALGKL